MPVVKWAEKVVARAKAGGMDIPEIESMKETTSEKSKKQ
jgi:citrate lyase subunit beta-like protein